MPGIPAKPLPQHDRVQDSEIPWQECVKRITLFTILALAARVAHADLSTPTVVSGLNPLEQRAAAANQAVFNALTAGTAPICAAGLRVAAGRCIGETFKVFQNTRELVHTANELGGQGATEFSLGLDREGLGFALRWTAAEELLAQGSMSTDFANSQLTALGGRISAIRIASRATLFADESTDDGRWLAAASRPLGGGASADPDGVFSRLSLFLDGSGGYGTKDPTNLEDAFDFEGQEVTLGLDYRISNQLVTGLLLGYSDRLVDFDSALSIVDGKIDSRGSSAILFLQYDWRHFYATGSAGYQKLSYDIVRSIRYPSFNPNVPSTNTQTLGETDSAAVLASLNLGVPFQWQWFGADLYLKADYQNIDLDAFAERDVNGSGFQFNVAAQTVKSLDAAVGLKLQAVWTPRFGVFVPYIRGEYHQELEDQPRTVSSFYGGLPSDVVQTLTAQGNAFSVVSDAPDNDYYTASAGISAVLRGSSRILAGGAAAGGLQGYIQYTKVFGLDNYDDQVVTGGIRYEF